MGAKVLTYRKGNMALERILVAAGVFTAMVNLWMLTVSWNMNKPRETSSFEEHIEVSASRSELALILTSVAMFIDIVTLHSGMQLETEWSDTFQP